MRCRPREHDALLVQRDHRVRKIQEGLLLRIVQPGPQPKLSEHWSKNGCGGHRSSFVGAADSRRRSRTALTSQQLDLFYS
jgi:hypothetical protein